MSHADLRERLNAYLEGELEPAEGARVRDHLAGCSACARELRELRGTVSLLRALPRPSPPPRLTDRVLERIAAGEAQPRRWEWSLQRGAGPRQVAALAAAVAGFAVITSLGPEVTGPPESRVPFGLARQTALTGARPAAPAGSAWVVRRGTGGPRRLVAAQWQPLPERLAEARRGLGLGQRAVFDPSATRLAGDLERLRVNPRAFLDEMALLSAADRQRRVLQLAELASRRGEEAEIADRLRSTPHPLAMPAVAPFERRTEPLEARAAVWNR